jgi:predicted acetyltransferase
MPDLIAPTTTLHRRWLEHRDDFGREAHLDGAGLHEDDDVDSEAGFTAWVARLNDRVLPLPDGKVRCTYWWIVEGGEVLGSIALRHELNPFLLEAGGHIGYSVRPSARRRGLATYALGEVLKRAEGIDRVLITCNVDNEPSRRTIEHFGGVQEDIRDTSIGRIRRYWIAR